MITKIEIPGVTTVRPPSSKKLRELERNRDHEQYQSLRLALYAGMPHWRFRRLPIEHKMTIHLAVRMLMGLRMLDGTPAAPSSDTTCQ